MSGEVFALMPELKAIIRELAGLPPTIETLSKVVDLTKRELIDTRKLIQNFRLESYRTLQTKLKRLTSTVTKFDTDNPQFEIKNPLDKDIKLLNLTMIPLPASQPIMITKIVIGDVTLFEPDDISDVGEFTDLASLSIAIPNEGKLWKKQTKIRIYLWGASSITCTYVWTVGEYF